MDVLPAEILIKILQYLQTYDLIQFCKSDIKFNGYLQERSLISTCNLSRKYETHNISLCKVIKNEMNKDLIIVLNINGIYWIPAEELRKLIRVLKNIEELQVIDTKLSLTDIEPLLDMKLRKLAVSITRCDMENYKSKQYNSLKLLYFKFGRMKKPCPSLQTRYMQAFVDVNQQLEELWVNDVGDFNRSPEHLVLQAVSLRKVFWRLNDWEYVVEYCDPKLCIDFQYCFDWHKIHSGMHSPNARICCLSFQLLANNKPCGLKHEKVISAENRRLYYELHLNPCGLFHCKSSCIMEAQKVLKSESCKELRRLRLLSDIFHENENKPPIKELETEIAFKRRRLGVTETSNNSFFEKVSLDLKFLQELEIASYKKGLTSSSVLNAFTYLPNLTNLRRLSMSIPALLTGSFLTKLFQKCTQLESFSIEMCNPNMPFMHNLLTGLKHATQLRDLRLEVPSINMEKLMMELCLIPTKKLLRMVVVSHIQEKTARAKAMYEDFFKKNPQLVLFYIVASIDTPKDIYRIIAAIRKIYRNHPAKIIQISRKDNEIDHKAFAHLDFIEGDLKIGSIDFSSF